MGVFEEVLTLVGAATLFVIAGFVLIVIFDGIKYLHEKIKRKSAIRRRFNKPPTAKCYCVDCKYWSKNSGYCSQSGGWYTADNWFCSKAEPKEKINE